jgi:hypothetical protein
MLAYLLRVNPELAQPRIERAIAARGGGFSACNQSLLQNISEIHYDPVLQQIAIDSLDDPDPQVAGSAATMLGKFGSPAAESALLQRYTTWNAKWAGRESQLEQGWGDRISEKVYELGLGQNLAQALATGNSWLADKNKLQRLSQMTKVRPIQQQLDSFLRNWQYDAISISVDGGPSPDRFHAQMAQYEFHSLAALKEKISQCPAETKFFLSISARETPAEDQSIIELRALLAAREAIKN